LCRRNTIIRYQSLLGNIINPDTPYKGMIVFHGLGTGKCVTPDTKIIIKENHEEINLTIDVLWIDYATNIVKDDIDPNAEWAIPSKNIYTFSYTGNYIEYKKINKLYREKINSLIKRYKLNDGTIIKSSETHKFLTDNNIWSNTLNSRGFYV